MACFRGGDRCGGAFTSRNAKSDPHVGIFSLRDDSNFGLRGGQEGEPALARFVFERTD